MPPKKLPARPHTLAPAYEFRPIAGPRMLISLARSRRCSRGPGETLKPDAANRRRIFSIISSQRPHEALTGHGFTPMTATLMIA